MLKSFMFRGQTIPLLPSLVLEEPSRKLFAADSMTLLIGPNGAGKTQAMRTIASAFTAKNQTSDDRACFDWDTNDFEETCAIYYTPVPFDVDIPNTNNRFIKIQPQKSKVNSISHNAAINELDTIFELDVRSKLSIGDLSRGSLFQLMLRVVMHRDGTIPFVKDQWVIPFRERFNNNSNARTEAWQHGYEFNSPEMQTIRNKSDEILTDFSIQLREQFGPEVLLKLRAYNYARSAHRNTKKTMNQLLEKVGFSLAWQRGAWGVASKTFDTAMEKLQRIARIIDDPSLSKNEYIVNGDQLHKLNALQLGKLASISLTGLSSGAAALINQFSSIRLACEEFIKNKSGKRLLLLIDEGDAFLHIQWQQYYVDFLDKTVQRLKESFGSIQVVIATHSPVLMSDFPRDCIFMLQPPDGTIDVFERDLRVSHSPVASFGAPLDAVVHHAGNAGTLGSFAARVMRQLVDDIESGQTIDNRRVRMIDDPVVSQQIERMLFDRERWANRSKRAD